MSLTKVTTGWSGARLGWVAALVLYAACWFLPVLRDAVGFDAARFAHESFWELLSGKVAVGSANRFLRAVFITVGWPANEIFLIGVATVMTRPRLSVRLLAFAFGIMIAWQVAFIDAFPLAIGYWSWVAAGAIALWLVADQRARERRCAARTILTERPNLALLLTPSLIAAIGVAVDSM